VRLRIALPLVAGSALALALSVPSVGAAPLAWIALVPFFAVLRRVGTASALLLAWGWCLLYAWGIASALPASIAEYAHQGLLLGWLWAIGCWTLMAAVYYMGFAWAYRRLAARCTGPALPLLVAAAWTAFEFGRGRLFTGTPFFIGNPWGLIGYSQIPWSTFAQVASLTGLYGMSFAVAAANAWGAEAILGTWRTPRQLASAGVLAAIPALAIIVYGAGSLAGEAHPTPAVEVVTVQSHLPNQTRWSPDHYGENLGVYLRLTRKAQAAADPRLVVWPESSLTFFLEDEPAYLLALRQVLAPGHATLLAGGVRSGNGPDGGPPFYNTVFHVSAAAGVLGHYDKELLVPFTEYSPVRGLDPQRLDPDRVREYSPGRDSGPIDTPVGRVGLLTCNEAMLPEVAGRRVAAGAEILVSPSNDGWIRDPAFAEHMLAIVSLRAIEQRRWLVRASTSGPSAVVDPWGRIASRTAFGERTWLSGAVEARRDRSLYGRVGDLFAFACCATVIGALAHSHRSFFRRRL